MVCVWFQDIWSFESSTFDKVYLNTITVQPYTVKIEVGSSNHSKAKNLTKELPRLHWFGYRKGNVVQRPYRQGSLFHLSKYFVLTLQQYLFHSTNIGPSTVLLLLSGRKNVEARPLGKSPTRLEKESSCRLDCTTLLGCASYIGRQHERELHRLHLNAGILSVKPIYPVSQDIFQGSKLVQGNLSLFLYSNCWKEAISSELEAVVCAKLTSALMLCKYRKNPSLFLAQDILLNFA
jgi:hypothetical protein